MEATRTQSKVIFRVPQLVHAMRKTPQDLIDAGVASRGTVYRWMRGDADGITFETLARVCDYLNVGIGAVLELDNDQA